MLAGLYSRASEAHHIRPDLINIRAVGEVHHVRREPAARSHVGLERDYIAFPAEMPLVLCEAEKLEVDEPAFHSEALYRSSSGCSAVLGELFSYIVGRLLLLVDYVHDGARSHVARLEDDISAVADYRVIGDYIPIDLLFHDEGDA